MIKSQFHEIRLLRMIHQKMVCRFELLWIIRSRFLSLELILTFFFCKGYGESSSNLKNDDFPLEADGEDGKQSLIVLPSLMIK